MSQISFSLLWEILESEFTDSGKSNNEIFNSAKRTFEEQVSMLNENDAVRYMQYIKQQRLSFFQNEPLLLLQKYITTKLIILQTHKTNTSTQEQETLADLFITKDWKKYFDVLTLCSPQLLKEENGKYTFVGNYKLHRGCVGQWIKNLKVKGIVNTNLNRDQIASILTSNIENFSINGSSIDNISNIYTETIEPQLKEYLNTIN